MGAALLHVGAVIISLWGIGHLIPTKNIVAGFGDLSADNRYVITMEWIIEGVTLIFLGAMIVLAVHILGADSPGARFVALASAAMLIVLAAISAFTGARTSVLPMKLCPFVKTTVAILYVVAAV